MEERDSTAPKISVYLCVVGMDLDPREFSDSTGLEATEECGESRATGRLVPSGEPYIRKPYWHFGYEKLPSYSLSDCIDDLLERLWPHRESICKYMQDARDKDVKASFVATITMYHERPVYDLQPDVLRRLASFGFELTMDIFDYRS